MRTLNILTWHVHGNYLYYLSQIPHNIYLPVNEERTGDYMGKGEAFPWGPNVHEVPLESVRDLDLDCVIFQRPDHYLVDQYEILSEEQRHAQRIYLEHDPPQCHPTDTRHCVDDPEVLLVHVTYFNQVMWDCGRTPTRVISHGVLVPGNALYTGELEKGLVIVNNIGRRGRRLGLDIFESVSRQVSLDLVGMGSEEVGGLGEIPPAELPYFIGRYRFVFNPIRHTSLGLAVCEAMAVGLPVVALATTEQPTVVFNDFNGYIHTNIDYLVERMNFLLKNRKKAEELGRNSREFATQQFGIDRFVEDWSAVFEHVGPRLGSGSLAVS